MKGIDKITIKNFKAFGDEKTFALDRDIFPFVQRETGSKIIFEEVIKELKARGDKGCGNQTSQREHQGC